MKLETVFKTDWPLKSRLIAALVLSAIVGTIYAINVAFHEHRKGMTKEKRKADDEALKNEAVYNMDMTHYEPERKAEDKELR